MSDDDALDPSIVCPLLNDALVLQYRSALAYTLTAGSLQGLNVQTLAGQLSTWAAEELVGARLLVEKVVALGGEPATDTPAVAYETDADKAVRTLADGEEEGIAALHAVISESGQEPRSEALEHLLEHEIMRKQQHLDTLRRALGE